jgi:SSS family solute:Na+ symporter
MTQTTFFIYIYIAAILAIGVNAKAKSLEKFVLGDRLNTRTMVATIVSTFYGASAILGGVSLTYQMGLGVIWFMVPFYLGNVAVIFLVRRIAGSTRFTLPDFLGDHYGRSFAIASSILLAMLCLIPEEIIAGGKLLAMLTSIPVDLGMACTALVLIVPVMIGGMRADVTSDIVQFVLMLFMLAAVIPLLLAQGPGAFAAAPAPYHDPFASISIQEIAVFSVSLFFLPVLSAPLYQRFFAAESEASARRSVIYSIVIWMAIDTIVVLCGFAALRLFPNLADPDLALIQLGVELSPIGAALFFVGLMAAIMSTVNSFLQSAASSISYDVVRHIWPGIREEGLLRTSRVLVAVFGLASLGLALWFEQIVPALLFTLSMWTAGMLIPTLAALTGIRLSPRVALFSLLSGAGAALLWRVVQPWPVDALFVGLGVSLAVTGIAHSIEKRSRDE